MVEPQGNPVTIYMFVDANHDGNVVMRIYYIGIIIYVQNSLTVWYSKKQNMVEAATFFS